MKIVDTKDKTVNRKDAIIAQLKERLDLSEIFEAGNRREGLDDLNMLAGIGHWPKELADKRRAENRPVLTINKLPSFVDQILNDSRLNKLSIKVLPNGGGASEELANTFAGLIRNIENISDADIAYQTALEGGVNNGFGYFRVITSYCDETSFDEEIHIKRIRDPFTVYMDPDSEELDGSDGKYFIITKMIDRKEYEVLYPNLAPPVPVSASGESWSLKDKVRIAEYWVKEPKVKRLILTSDQRTLTGEDYDKLLEAEKVIHLEADPNNPEEPIEVEGPAPEGSDFPQTTLNPAPKILREREIDSFIITQYIADGEKVISETPWAGMYLPIIPVWGKELIISGVRYLRGAIRFAKDPQRMYNYFRTAATETVALTPKAPYLMEEGQIEGHRTEWDSLGVSNLPYLLYKNVPGIVAPTRQIVTQTAIGEITEANVANDEMKAVTSLYDASLGAQGNEVSGRAISARQAKSDIANFAFHDNLKRAVKYCGKILVDLIPRIYDTERQILVVGEDEVEQMVMINQESNGKIINNMSVGRYKIVVTSGPSFNTQRVEAVQSMLDFIRVTPDSSGLIMDLVAENMDWPGAAKIAKRFKKLLPPGIDDDQPVKPPEPTIDDVIKDLKSKGIMLGNEQKKLNIVQKRRELSDETRGYVEAGAIGAMKALGIGGDQSGGI